MSINAPTPSAHLETDLWRWLLFESGLTRRRAREIILQGAQSSALSLFWQAGPVILAQQLGLAPAETALVTQAQAAWAQIEQRFEAERSLGIKTVRLNDLAYPPSLTRFLPLDQRPMLLFLRGEAMLLDMPMILPAAKTPPNAATETWLLDALAELTAEGALALFIARAGFEARCVKAFLDVGLPFALVIPQGLAAYAPPAALQQAVADDLALVISPFQPDWQPPDSGPNPLLPHAIGFARTLAHALLSITPPAAAPCERQPCFRGPDVPAIEHCPDAYEGPEALFLRLAESLAQPHSLQKSAPTPPQPAPEPISPEEILETLTKGGHIPTALAARLKKRSH